MFENFVFIVSYTYMLARYDFQGNLNVQTLICWHMTLDICGSVHRGSLLISTGYQSIFSVWFEFFESLSILPYLGITCDSWTGSTIGRHMLFQSQIRFY